MIRNVDQKTQGRIDGGGGNNFIFILNFSIFLVFLPSSCSLPWRDYTHRSSLCSGNFSSFGSLLFISRVD